MSPSRSTAPARSGPIGPQPFRRVTAGWPSFGGGRKWSDRGEASEVESPDASRSRTPPMNRLLLTAAAVALTATAVAAPGSRAAEPGQVLGCGSVVTTNVTLTADITGCTGDGLVVGRDGITIDLGRHRLSGGLGYSDVAAPGSVGVRIGRHDGVTVKGAATDPMALENNEIVGFETAVLLGNGAQNNTVKRLNLRGVRFGVALRKA